MLLDLEQRARSRSGVRKAFRHEIASDIAVALFLSVNRTIFQVGSFTYFCCTQGWPVHGEEQHDDPKTRSAIVQGFMGARFSVYAAEVPECCSETATKSSPDSICKFLG